MIMGQVVLGAYFPGTDDRTYRIDAMPAGLLTHVFYAFATIEDGTGATPRCWPGSYATGSGRPGC